MTMRLNRFRMKHQMLVRRISAGGKLLAAAALSGLAGCTIEPGTLAIAPPVVTAPVLYAPRIAFTPRIYAINPPIFAVRPAVVAPPQDPAPEPANDSAAADSPAADPQIEQLVAPIALYPDPLLAVVLPASTYPQQVREAGQFLAANPSPSADLIDAQQWEPSVKALVRYPDALEVLDKDPQWTDSLGSAFANQPAEVTAAVQDLRSRAVAANNLVATPQVAIVQENNVIAIQPADPAVIYVPRYDPVVVFSGYSPVVYASYYPVGPWLVNGYDWNGEGLFVGDWHGPYYWHDGRWGYDRYWHGHYSYWHHDGRWGRAPYARTHYASARGIRGHENAFHQAIVHSGPGHNVTRQTVTRQTGNGPAHSGPGGERQPARAGQQNAQMARANMPRASEGGRGEQPHGGSGSNGGTHGKAK